MMLFSLQFLGEYLEYLIKRKMEESDVLVNFWFLFLLKEYLECLNIVYEYHGEKKWVKFIFIYEISGSEVHLESHYFFSM